MFARTDRLLLRPIWQEDAPTLYKAIADEKIVRNLAQAPWPYTIKDAEGFSAIEHAKLTPNFMLMRRTHAAPELIGSCGLAENEKGIEIGYWIARKYWGLGYASEAAQSVLEIAHSLGHETIHAVYFTDNPASANVLRKLGFKRNGKLTKRYSKGRNATINCVPMIIKDLSETIALHEKKGGNRTDVFPPDYYDAYHYAPSVNTFKTAA